MNIFNWDVVHAVSCHELNKALGKYIFNSYGPFEWIVDKVGGINGQFKDWEIIAGGNSQHINITTRLASGNLKATVMGRSIDSSVDGLQLKIQIDLGLISGRDGKVVVLNHDMNKIFDEENTIIPTVFGQIMIRMISADSEKLMSIFSKILRFPDEKIVPWMKLQLHHYAYSEKVNGELGDMAVLGILSNNATTLPFCDLQASFDSSLVRENGSAGFMISRQAFMQNIILPALPDVFNHVEVAQFKLDENAVIRESDIFIHNKNEKHKPRFGLGIRILDDCLIINDFSGIHVQHDGKTLVGFDVVGHYYPKLSKSDGHYRVDFINVHKGCFTPVFNVFELGAHENIEYINCGLADNFYIQN